MNTFYFSNLVSFSFYVLHQSFIISSYKLLPSNLSFQQLMSLFSCYLKLSSSRAKVLTALHLLIAPGTLPPTAGQCNLFNEQQIE